MVSQILDHHPPPAVESVTEELALGVCKLAEESATGGLEVFPSCDKYAILLVSIEGDILTEEVGEELYKILVINNMFTRLSIYSEAGGLQTQ